MLDAVMQRLRSEYEKLGDPRLFAALVPYLGGSGSDPSVPGYQETAAALGIPEGHLRVVLFRLRKRYRKLLRSEILGTLTDPAEVDNEIRELFGALSRP